MTSFLAPLALALAAALDGSPVYDAAVAAWGELEYEEALVGFQAVEGADDAERARLTLWIALCEAGLGDLDAARLSMRAALALDPQLTLPPAVAPRVVAIFDEEQAAARAATAAPAAPVEVAPVSPPLPPTVWAGGASLGVGVVALGGAAVWSVLAFEQLAIVDDDATFQDDARVALDNANTNAGLAIGASVVGVALASVGVVMLAVGLGDEGEGGEATPSPSSSPSSTPTPSPAPTAATAPTAPSTASSS